MNGQDARRELSVETRRLIVSSLARALVSAYRKQNDKEGAAGALERAGGEVETRAGFPSALRADYTRVAALAQAPGDTGGAGPHDVCAAPSGEPWPR